MQALWIALYAIGGLLAFVLLVVLFASVRIRIRFREEVALYVSLLGIRIKILPKKKKEPKDLNGCKHPERVMAKEERKREKARLKAERKRLKAEEKKKKKAQAKAKQKDSSQPPKPNLSENLHMILALVQKIYRLTQGKIHVQVNRMHIKIGTPDAAKTALLYGAVLQSASYLLEWIHTHFISIRRDDGDMTIEPDFQTCKTSADVDIKFRLRILDWVIVGIRAFLAYKKESAKAKASAAKRAREKSSH